MKWTKEAHDFAEALMIDLYDACITKNIGTSEALKHFKEKECKPENLNAVKRYLVKGNNSFGVVMDELLIQQELTGNFITGETDE